MTSSTPPRVSVGMPVYNGEKYVAMAIESVLAQTYADFELMICDNASTDRTEEICRAYAARDARVRYLRNEKNLGAGPNYNRTFTSATGTDFFKWLAHDDVIAPTYLEKCIAALDANPDAVLCQSIISNIDQHGVERSTYDSQLTVCRTASSPSERFAEAILKEHRNTDVFGLVRRKAMIGSILHGNFYCQDKGFVAQMSVRGRFLLVAEPLLGYRDHPDQFTHALRVSDTPAWHNTTIKRWNRAAYLMLFLHYVKCVHLDVRGWRERLRCYPHLVRWWFTDKNFSIATVGIISAVSPSAFQVVRRTIDRVRGRHGKLPYATPKASG
jgi:glycosyltransferase involved in cell wall biosynthesis